MTWVKLDDSFPDHPKAAKIGSAGRDLFVASLCYCNRVLTDGFIPSAMAPRLCELSDTPHLTFEDVMTRLCDAKLWESEAGGFRIHDYDKYQPSKSKVQAGRDQARERMANMRSRSGDVRTNFSGSSLAPVPDQGPEPENRSVFEEQAGLERTIARVADLSPEGLMYLEAARKRGAPVSVFHAAYDDLQVRRQKPGLRSEGAYFVGRVKAYIETSGVAV